MPTRTLLVKNLRKTLSSTKAKWTVNLHLRDSDKLPRYSLGGDTKGLLSADKISKLNFKKVLQQLPGNPYLLRRRLDLGILDKKMISKAYPSLIQPDTLTLPPMGGTTPTSVDWRNRWGWPWITTIRDQNGCNACWAFAATALVEAMVRIEHCVWPVLSEGDVHKGMGAVCANLGGSGTALDWIADHGLADPGCFAWTNADIPYNPTADRSGRSVRCPKPAYIGNTADQKKWLDTVGPLVTWFDVWTDFFGYGNGVYHKQNMIGNTANKSEGGHFMLVVGYDDTQNCWIVKNSWGNSWGENGYARIGYGETGIDTYAKISLQNVNPDPWTKRRYHNGNLLESGNGGNHRNFEMLATIGAKIQLWWRDNAAATMPWNHTASFGSNDATACPTFISTTFNRNFECVYPTNGNRLHHWWFKQPGGPWYDGGIFGPVDTAGIPGLVQSNYNAPGNFEVVVRTADNRLNHWWRDGGGWHDGGRFGSNVAYSGPSLIQSHYGQQDNFELVCVLYTGQMQHWWRDNDGGMSWHQGTTFGSGVASPPCMIEASFGEGDETQVGNFELCVAVGGKVEHWWRYNHGDMIWRKSATFGHNVKSVVGLIQGSYGFNLEVVVLRTDNKLQHYWRYGGTWNEGVVIGSI